MEAIVVTAPVFQRFAERVKATLKSLKAVAPWNMLDIFVTKWVSQEVIF